MPCQGGEDLEEDEDEEAGVDDEAPPFGVAGPSRISEAEDGLRGLQQRRVLQPPDLSKPLEGSPLLSRLPTQTRDLSRSRRRQRSVSGAPGDATVTQAVLMVCWGWSVIRARKLSYL